MKDASALTDTGIVFEKLQFTNSGSVHRGAVENFFFKQEKFTDPVTGVDKYTYIPTGAGLDEKDLKLNLLNAFDTASSEIWQAKVQYATTLVTTDRKFERVPIHFGTIN